MYYSGEMIKDGQNGKGRLVIYRDWIGIREYADADNIGVRIWPCGVTFDVCETTFGRLSFCTEFRVNETGDHWWINEYSDSKPNIYITELKRSLKNSSLPETLEMEELLVHLEKLHLPIYQGYLRLWLLQALSLFREPVTQIG